MKICKRCQQPGKTYRTRWHGQNNKYYEVTICKDCEKLSFQEYQKNNLEYFRQANRKSYLKRIGGKRSRRSPLEMTDELRKEWYRDKANKRATRAKQARVAWDKEFTNFVYEEAHKLRKQRNSLFGFQWHVDHIIPLKGKNVCGLHVWNNFAVIPKVENLRKGNNHAVHA